MRWLLFCLLCASTLFNSAEAGCSRPLRLHTSVVSAQTYWRDINWLRYVFSENGCELTVLNEDVASLGRLLRSLETGKHDLITGLSRTPERDKTLYFSVSYTADRVRLYAHRDKQTLPEPLTLPTLHQHNISIVLPLQGWYGPELEQFRQQHLNSAGVLSYQNDWDGLRIVRQHPDAVLVMSERIFVSLDSPELLPLAARGADLFNDPLHIAFSRQSVSKSDFEHINTAIKTMLARGLDPDAYAAGQR